METIVLDEKLLRKRDREDIADRLIDFLLYHNVNLGSFKFSITVNYEESEGVEVQKEKARAEFKQGFTTLL